MSDAPQTVPGATVPSPGRPRLLRPVLGLTDRLRTRSRLLLLVGVLLVPSVLAAGSFAVVIGGQVRFAEYERAGVAVVGPAIQALATSAAGGSPDLTRLRAAVSSHPELGASPALRAVQEAAPGPDRTAALGALVRTVGDSSKLILDPDLDSFYVMDALVVQLPRALEVLGTPASSTGGQPVQIAPAFQAGLLTLRAESLATDVATAVRSSRSASSMSRDLQPVQAFRRQLSALAELTGGTGLPAAPEVAAARADAVRGGGLAGDALARQLDVLLQDRAQALALRRDGTLALTLGGLLVAVWIAAAVIWRTRHDVSLTLVGVAAISDGDLQERDLPKGLDEFGDIGRAVHGARQRLERLLFRDPLTGLPNRPMFLDRLQEALGDPSRSDVTVLFLDLDRFKAVNDRLGHAMGDELLRAAAQRIQACAGADDTAARFGGDEFAVVLRDQGAGQGRLVAERIVAALREPFTLTAGPVHIGVTVGIAVAQHGISGDDLLAQADVALYGAKRDGGGCARLYDPALRDEHVQRLQLEADLQSALPDDQLAVVYQPIVSLDIGAVTGVEALLRWQRPGVGLVPPLAFIPLAEANGLIVDIGRWVLQRTCEQLVGWRRLSPGLVANVNVSARQLGDPAFVATVEAALRCAGLPGHSLTLEITESILLQDRAQLLDRLHALRDLGVRIALDDFGTGYSCLSYLRSLPVDVLKIDRSFVSGTTTGDVPLVRTVVGLGHALGLSTTAEGIETHDQWQMLRGLGCRSGQGYYFARPLSAAAVVEHLTTMPAPRVPGRPPARTVRRP
ncbi:MAG TPA: EAL domain-containing protein [Actinomycetales bacterium]|jgi:diguanylate cyclase (GGDEF)-like protein